ncbi:MAG TPA: hypothetical protein VEU74_11495 [Gemmatimonadales bacterium]|nr:hypothetical protein [Gemmatimonadales bacterium]
MSLRGRALFVLTLLAVLGCGSSSDETSGASRPTVGVTADIVAPRGETQPDYYQRQVLLINKWIREAGPPPRSSAGILEIVRQSRDESGKLADMPPYDLVTTLDTWLKAAQDKDSVRQAAAYLVADRVLRLAWHPFNFTDPSQQLAQVRSRLKALGASSELSAASGEMAYAGGWVQQAARLDPTGPMGQRAALLQLEADCAGGDSPQPYYGIVARLEPLVTTPADSEVKWTAQLLEADAYRDIVALASGLGKANADSTKFQPDAESAKARAIALYQAALAGDTASRLAKGGQATLARLTGGLAPTHVRFFCFGQ